MPSRDGQDRICGFLEVDETGKRKKFEHRFIVLDKKKGFLEWYKNDPSKSNEELQPCGQINLFYITKVDIVTRSKLQYCFVVNTPYRPYYMQASNQLELEEWAEIVNDAGKITVPADALRPQQTNEPENGPDTQDHSVALEAETTDVNFQTRTEIVGGVVVKKKLTSAGQSIKGCALSTEKVDEPLSPIMVHSGGSNSTLDNISNFSFSDQVKREEDKTVIKSGWAVKQGHLRKNWKRRYFVLRTDGFSYYKSDQDKEAIRTIPMQEVLTAKQEMGDTSKVRDNLLFVATTDKIYYMQADTPEEMKSWIDSFQSASKLTRTESQKKKALRVSSEAASATTRLKPKVQPSKPGKEVRHSPSSRGGGKRTSHLASSQWQSTSNLIPVVPLLHRVSAQVVDDDMSIGLGRPDDSAEAKKPPIFQQLRKRSSAQSMCSSSQDSAIHSSCDSLDKGADGGVGDAQRRNRQTHRRADSFFTILPTQVTGSAYSSIQTGNKLRDVGYDREDVMPRPESAHIRLAESAARNDSDEEYHPDRLILHRYSTDSTSKSHSRVLNHLDPTVDCRSAVKPSSIKKKKNSGIMFSLNTMLSRKADKMNKPSTKKGAKYKGT